MPGAAGRRQPFIGQVDQAGPGGQTHHRNQTGMRDSARRTAPTTRATREIVAWPTRRNEVLDVGAARRAPSSTASIRLSASSSRRAMRSQRRSSSISPLVRRPASSMPRHSGRRGELVEQGEVLSAAVGQCGRRRPPRVAGTIRRRTNRAPRVADPRWCWAAEMSRQRQQRVGGDVGGDRRPWLRNMPKRMLLPTRADSGARHRGQPGRFQQRMFCSGEKNRAGSWSAIGQGRGGAA